MSASHVNAVRSGIPHMPALDGLRGLAVLAILLFHDARLPGGWLGVDVFFVLSGFLITSLLLSEHAETGRLSLLSFWGRRARRLLPALFVLLFGVCAYAGFVAQPEELSRIRADAIATLFYVANWQAIFAGHDYWEIFQLPSPLDHTWSLAIEEQFYLLWPPVVLLVLRLSGGSAAMLQRTAWALACASALGMAWLYDPSAGSARVYFGTDTRGAATLVGAALAAGMRARVQAWPASSTGSADAAAAAALSLLIGASVVLSGTSPLVYRGGLFALILAAGVVIAGVVLSPTGFCARALSTAPLRALGVLSYGIYLWHWPIYLVLDSERTGLGSFALSGLRFTTTLLISMISYYSLERPIRKGGFRVGSLMRGAALSTGALLVCIWFVTRAPESEGRTPAPVVASDTHPQVLLIGDSLAKSLEREFPEEARKRGYRAQVLAAPGCGALESDALRDPAGQVSRLSGCRSLRKQWASRAREASPRVVILLEGWPGERERLIGDVWAHACQGLFDRAHSGGLSNLAQTLSATGAGFAVVIAPLPSVVDLRPAFIQRTEADSNAALETLLVERLGCLNRVRREVAAREYLRVIDLAAEICPAGRCRERYGDLPLRPDGLHFRGSSAIWLSGWLLDQIEDAAFDSALRSGREPRQEKPPSR